jgi:ferredoxin
MSESKNLTFQMDGETFHAQEGQSIAEALLDNGITHMRDTQGGKPRCAFCGMGICYECRMIVNGTPNVRVCVTPVTPGCKVEKQHDSDIEKSGGSHD